MKPKIFVSYSRREVSFIDELVSDLEQQGFNVWLDYRRLIPGTPWADQITKGIDDADVILLLVSKASIASKNVEVEWRRTLKEKKRVMLAIFEAVDLPRELEKYEWVDFRSNYKHGLAELVSQLQKPAKEEYPAPETGFQVPAVVWVAALLSVIVAALSIPALWTLFIPFVLLPLAYRVFKRDYKFIEVQLALVLVPISLFLTAYFVEDENIHALILDLMYVSIPFVLGLLFVLRSQGMQRWGMPSATLPNFSNTYKPDNPHPKPVSFYVDHAPEDAETAKDFYDTLAAYGHSPAEDMQRAKAVFTLISGFKRDTDADPQKQVVYPVILQTNNAISPKLSKVQWLDLRSGVRHLHAIAQLLPDPSKLLRALGIRPMGNELVLPSVIMSTRYFLFLLTIFTFGSWLPYFTQFMDEIIPREDWTILIQFPISLILFGGVAYWMIRSLVTRRGWFANFWFFGGGIVILGLLIFWQCYLNEIFLEQIGAMLDEQDRVGLSANYPAWIYLGGLAIVAAYMALRRRDLARWFLPR